MRLLSSLIILNCEDHVLFVLIHLTGVLCHLFKFFSSYQVLHLFSTGVLSKFVPPCSLFISFQPEWFNPFLSIVLVIHSFATSKVHMVFLVSIFLPQCSQLCSTLLCPFFQFFNLSRFFGFTLLSKKQLSFTSSLPLPFLSGAILDLGTRSSRSGGVL